MRAIDADRLVEIFDTIPDKESTAIFIPKIVEVIEEQSTLKAEKISNWIDVENDLPDNDANVLVCDIDGDIHMGYLADYDGWRRAEDYEKIKSAVAWMPLPEPYHMADK